MEENAPLIAPATTVRHGRKLPVSQRLSYGVGHVLNDLCASMWFSYLLIYFHKVLGFTNAMAGGLLLLGQISDGICTPLIGFESDRTKTGFFNYGRRKSWHLVGTLCVIGSFTFIYQPIMGGIMAENWAQFIYYAPFVVIFQFGWAATQISHLSLIPELTTKDGERVELNAIRYAFTVMSSILVYTVTFVLLRLHDIDDDMSTVNSSLDSTDIPQFRYLVIIVVAVGTLFSAIFHIGTKEPKERRRYSVRKEEDEKEEGQGEISGTYGSVQASEQSRLKMKWSCWFKEPQFYQVTALYMFTRLMVNIAQIYIPMYVTDTLNLDKESVALVPLVVYISGFLSTVVAKPINRICGRKLTYFIGAALYLGACVWMAIPDIDLQVYGAAILLGAGGSTVLVTSLALAADLIGQNTESGAFVFGAMSFTDKLSNGIAVEIIQLLQPCVHCCPGCKAYYKVVMTFVTGGAAIGAIIVLATLIPVTIGKRKKKCSPYPPIGDDTNHVSINSDNYDSDSKTTSHRQDKDSHPTLSNGSVPQSGQCDRRNELKSCADIHDHIDEHSSDNLHGSHPEMHHDDVLGERKDRELAVCRNGPERHADGKHSDETGTLAHRRHMSNDREEDSLHEVRT